MFMCAAVVLASTVRSQPAEHVIGRGEFYAAKALNSIAAKFPATYGLVHITSTELN